MRDDKVNSKLLPCLTFCPWHTFKKKGFFYNRGMLNQNTFQINDIFVDDTVKRITNSSKFWIKDVASFILGRCVTVCYLEAMGFIGGFTLELRKNWDVVIFIHNR